jgi:hypothetical protein
VHGDIVKRNHHHDHKQKSTNTSAEHDEKDLMFEDKLHNEPPKDNSDREKRKRLESGKKPTKEIISTLKAELSKDNLAKSNSSATTPASSTKSTPKGKNSASSLGKFVWLPFFASFLLFSLNI